MSLLPASHAQTLWLSRHLLLLVLVVLAFVLNLCLGSVTIPLSESWTYLNGGTPSNPAYAQILSNIRLPKALTAATAGAALSVAGLLMQTLFRNPLADPFVLGINSGASLGVALVVLALGPMGIEWLEGMGLGANLGMVLAATLGAATVLMLVLYLARRVDMMTLLIVGLMVGYATSALVSILMYLSIPERLQSYLSWTFGSFGNVDARDLNFFLPACVVGGTLAFLCAKPLNAFLLGEAYARSLGVATRRLRAWLIVASAVLSGAVTAYCGPIGFIGVAVPHLCRSLLRTTDHRALLPACVLAGATVALFADLVAQVPGTYHLLPLNAVTALIGAPVILWILLRSQGLRTLFAR